MFCSMCNNLPPDKRWKCRCGESNCLHIDPCPVCKRRRPHYKFAYTITADHVGSNAVGFVGPVRGGLQLDAEEIKNHPDRKILRIVLNKDDSLAYEGFIVDEGDALTHNMWYYERVGNINFENCLDYYIVIVKRPQGDHGHE